jgi:hypothetical protein
VRRKDIKAILARVQKGTLKADAALQRLKFLPYEDLGFAKVDTHRHLRRGFPEVIFGEGKTVAQIIGIMGRVAAGRQTVLVTRVTPAVSRAVRRHYRRAKYHAAARAITLEPFDAPKPRPGLLVLAAGTSDLPVAEEAAVTAEAMGYRAERIYDVGIAGIHRLLDHCVRLQAARVIISVAGMEGALPSVVASLVDVPVIGVPTSIGYGTGFKGAAAIMGMLNSCSSGLTVVNIDNGFGAGYAAALILNSINNNSQ